MPKNFISLSQYLSSKFPEAIMSWVYIPVFTVCGQDSGVDDIAQSIDQVLITITI
jgi:hypothetical protein